MLPRTVSQGNSAASWNMSAVRPLTATVPAAGLSSPASRLSSVLLPQPEAPTRQQNSPGATSSGDAVEGEGVAAPGSEDLGDAVDRDGPGTEGGSRGGTTMRPGFGEGRSRGHLGLAGGLEDLVEEREVVDPVELRLLSSRPTVMASAAPLRRLAATGSLVNVRFGQAASITAWAMALPVSFSIPWLTSALASAALALTKSLAATWPSRSRLTTSGCSLRKSVRTIRWVVTYWPSGHRVRSSTRTLPPPSWTSRVAQGSGTQAPAMGRS